MLKRCRVGSASNVLTLDGYAEGYLSKQGRTLKTWKKRYFVFQNGYLAYRKDSREKAKVLRKDIITDVCYWSGTQHGLCVVLSTGEPMYLSAMTEEHAGIWFEVFHDYLQTKKKTGGLDYIQKKLDLARISECNSDLSATVIE